MAASLEDIKNRQYKASSHGGPGSASEVASLPPVSVGFSSLQSFELLQRGAKLLAASTMVPTTYQNNLPNCVIALNMATRMGADPLMIMQNLYPVHGRPSWSAKFLIATFNLCGRFSSIRYNWKGTRGTKEWGCQAWAIEKATNTKLEGPWIDWALVEAEGWNRRNGSKWVTMPEKMFMYRAGAWFVDLYAAELSMGLSTAEEAHDVYDAERDESGAYRVQERADEMVVVDAETGEINRQSKADQTHTQAQAEPAATPPQGAATQPAPAPGINDAMDHVANGDFDLALDLARSLPAAERKQVEDAVTAAQADESGQADAFGSFR